MKLSVKDYEKLENIFQTNMNLFAQFLPQVHEKLIHTYMPNIQFKMNRNEEININYKGEDLYPSEVYDSVRRQFNQFVQNPDKVNSQAVDIGDEVEGKNFHITFLKRTQEMSPIYGVKKGVYNKLKLGAKEIPIFMVFGLGIGYHLEMILNTYEIKRLILVEQDWELFKASLYIMNWGQVFKYFSISNERGLYIILEQTPEKAASKIVQEVRDTNPIFMNNAVTLHHYQAPFFKVMINRLRSEINLITSGWGYFDDELSTLEQTMANVWQRLPIFSHLKQVRGKTAFIAAAGPSLDKALDFLHEHRECGVLFSCGTALRSLYKAGIRPDFHVTIERTYPPYKALIQGLPAEYLRNIPIIAPSRIYPGIFELTNTPLMYAKLPDAGGGVFHSNIPRIPYDNPTVTNGALTMAVALGFEEIVLMGVDFGSKDPKHHHSQGTVYYEKGQEFYTQKAKYPLKMEGYEGEDVYTSRTLFWSKRSAEEVIQACQDINFLNFSDGAMIEGAEHLSVDELTSKLKPLDLNGAVKSIIGSFDTQYLRYLNMDKVLNNLIQDFNVLLLPLKAIIQRQVRTRNDLINIFYDLFQELNNRLAHKNYILYKLIDGTLIHMQNIVFTHAYAIRDESQAVEFANNGLMLMEEFLDTAQREVEALKQ